MPDTLKIPNSEMMTFMFAYKTEGGLNYRVMWKVRFCLYGKDSKPQKWCLSPVCTYEEELLNGGMMENVCFWGYRLLALSYHPIAGECNFC